MISYISRSTDPAWNLALEEYFFETVPAGESFFMLWQNHNTVVIGKNQNTLAEIDRDFVRSHGITVVRRLSGGGAVYHDDGNINFTFITDAPEGSHIDLRRFCLPVAEALRSFGVNAQISGRNDMTVDGKKFSGNAQYIRHGRVMHHGTLMFDSDMAVLQQVLTVDPEKVSSKGIQSVASRVTNLKPCFPAGTSCGEFMERLMEAMTGSKDPTIEALSAEARSAIQKLKEDRYDTWQWNYGYSPRCSITNSRRIDGCGRVIVQFSVEEGRLKGVQISGDFFGSLDVSALCALLEGCENRSEAVLQRLRDVDLSEFIHNFTAKDLISLLMA